MFDAKRKETYLDSLADAVGLEPRLVGGIHATMQADREAA